MQKKLIEFWLPINTINGSIARYKHTSRGNPLTIHKWWGRLPLTASRAILFAQMVDDPAGYPDLFPTERAQQIERDRLFQLIALLVQWESASNESVIQQAKEEIRNSWQRLCARNTDHPYVKQLFDPDKPPGFYDPFAGGGTLPLEAQRLGLATYATDLNPVAVLINKAIVEIPSKFADKHPINPQSNAMSHLNSWKGTQGLIEDVRYYAQRMQAEAENQIGHLYPRIVITPEMVMEQVDLQPYIGRNLPVIAWLWTRTVNSPNPAFREVSVPLASNFMLSSRAGSEIHAYPIIESKSYRFSVKLNDLNKMDAAKQRAKLPRKTQFRCLMSGSPISTEYIYNEAMAGRLGARLMAIVAEADHGRIYISPTADHETIARQAHPVWYPDVMLPTHSKSFSPAMYGLKTYGELFTYRQLVALATLSDLVPAMRQQVIVDYLDTVRKANHATNSILQESKDKEQDAEDDLSLADGGRGARAYADAICIYLAMIVDKTAEYNSMMVRWYANEDRPKGAFIYPAIPMVWEYAEVNLLANTVGTFNASIREVSSSLASCSTSGIAAVVKQLDARCTGIVTGSIISTELPCNDNIIYADLSEYFYIWLRRALKSVLPDLFASATVPKMQELVVAPDRHGGREKAETFYFEGITQAIQHIATQAHTAFPTTIFYTGKDHKGWETLLSTLIQAGFAITGTWPIRREAESRLAHDVNYPISTIVIVCRTRNLTAAAVPLQEFLAVLQRNIPNNITDFEDNNILPVDFDVAMIGPGLAIFTHYAAVFDSSGKVLTVREADGFGPLIKDLMYIHKVSKDCIRGIFINTERMTRRE